MNNTYFTDEYQVVKDEDKRNWRAYALKGREFIAECTSTRLAEEACEYHLKYKWYKTVLRLKDSKNENT